MNPLNVSPAEGVTDSFGARADTVRGAEADLPELRPTALTETAPAACCSGTVMVAVAEPVSSVVTVAAVVISLLSRYSLIVSFALKLVMVRLMTVPGRAVVGSMASEAAAAATDREAVA